ncbi:hypothetical protein [Candidatus Igneacidithiobacillus taiwanensis]|uniref:hypothetical protein n=1 Tax=Candidatus Igneacidithiobacillus taiwanensis TaxID=1945924 RepID=UPI00289D0970|nr:hypothetical protein [Candidatus Igneacidithiobacillus taiwanensis]
MTTESRDIVRWMALRTSLRNTQQIEGTLREAITKSHFPSRHTLEIGWGWRQKLVYALFRLNQNRPFHLVNREYETLTDDPPPNFKMPLSQYTEYGLFLQPPEGIGVKSDYSGIWLYNSTHRPWDSRKWAKHYLENWLRLRDFLQEALSAEESREWPEDFEMPD